MFWPLVRGWPVVEPWILIPAKPFGAAKQRLAPVLDAPSRAALARALLTRTLRVARTAFPASHCLVVSPTAEVAATVAAAGGELIITPEGGLNEQLAQAAARVPVAAALLVLHADLPCLAVADLAAMLASPGHMVLAPDRADMGSNALLQRRVPRIFAFGPDSCHRHQEAARAHGLTVTFVRRPGLARDLDTPEDWAALRGIIDAEMPPFL